jgi:hypothetical protein
LEMFTYVVCPNCPYASDSLRALRADLPEEVFVVEWHSGFSTLPLYDARWKQREVYYSGGTPIGYPSTTVAGELPLLVGGQSSDLSQYRPKSTAYLAQCTNECPLALRLEGTIGAASAELSSSRITSQLRAMNTIPPTTSGSTTSPERSRSTL